MKKKRNKKTRGRTKAQSCKMQKDQKTRARKESAKGKKNRRSTKDFKLGTSVANFCFGKRIEKTQILRSLQITAAMAEHRATAEENARATDFKKKKKTQEESSAASQRAIAWLAKPP
jgi:hypothetical protein